MARKPRAKQEPQDQPRSLSPEIAVQPELVRAGMYLTLQKFGHGKRDEEARQLTLFEAGQAAPQQAAEPAMDVIGLDLSVSEDRALHALQVLLDRTGYQGNLPGQEIDSAAWSWRGVLPRLAITYTDFFEAFQLQRMGDGSFYGHQADQALEALASLQQARTIYYKRKRWTGTGKARRAVYDVIKTVRPLISVDKGWQALTEEEASRVLAGQEEIEGRTTRLVIEFSPLWIDGIESFYLLKPVALHAEIQQILGSKRISKAVSLFIEWLLTLSISPLRISKELLAERLRLDYLLKQRKRTEVDKRLSEAFETARELGFLLSYQEEASGMLLLELNPERCQRLQPGLEPEEEA